MRAPALRPGDSAGCAGGSGSNLYTGSRHQERTDLWASAAVHHRPVSSGVGQTPPGGQLGRVCKELIAGRNAPELLQAVEQAFHSVARPISLTIEAGSAALVA